LPGRAAAMPALLPQRSTALLVMAGLCLGVVFALTFMELKLPDHAAPPEPGIATSTR